MNKSVVVCGLMKNANHIFNNIMKNIYDIVDVFNNNYKIIIVKSNSTDGTKESLLNAKTKDERLIVINHDFDLSSQDFNNRELRISICRNLYLKALYQMENIYDYVIMIDLDEIFSEPFDTENLEKVINFENWDVLFANQTDRYYDIWALKGALGVDYDCWKMIYECDNTSTSFESKKKKYINSKQIQIPRNHSPIRVKSAFGGLGIYKYQILMDTKILYEEKKSVCEHVGFHERLVMAGYNNLFIHPNLLIQSPDNEDYKNYFI